MSNISATHHLNDDLKFLIVCCQTNPSDKDINFIHTHLSTINHALSENPLGVQLLTSMANQHGILPLVYKTLKGLNSNGKLLIAEHEILSGFKQQYLSIAQRNMLMSAELICIMQLLKKNGIESLAFKGPTLSKSAYGDITLRQFGDIDILIKKRARFQMMDLLLKEHYIPEIDLKEGTKETFFNSVNVIAFYNESTGVRIEIHWELLSRNYAINWEEKSLWDRQEYIRINNKEIPVLSTEQQLLYLAAHGSKHLFERLEWICDIDRSIRTNTDINWGHLLNEAEKLGIKRMLYLGLELSRSFLHLELPESIVKHIEQDKEIPNLISKVIEANFSETSQKGKSYSSFGLLWSMRENLSDQLQFSWSGLFTPKFDDFVFIQLPKYLAFLYPIVRPYRLLTKYFNR